MGFADRFMHTFESVMAFPFAFIFGYDNSPEPQWRDPEPDKPAEAPSRHDPAPAAPEPVPDVDAAALASHPAAERLAEQRFEQTRLQERRAWEESWLDAQEQQEQQTRAASLRDLPDALQSLVAERARETEAARERGHEHGWER